MVLVGSFPSNATNPIVNPFIMEKGFFLFFFWLWHILSFPQLNYLICNYLYSSHLFRLGAHVLLEIPLYRVHTIHDDDDDFN